MIQEFKEFINRGNVIDLAVAVVIGAAFTAVVGAFVENLVNPLIGIFLGGVDFSMVGFSVGDAFFGIGAFIMAIINFIVIAFVVFLVVKMYNRLNKADEEVEEDAGPSEVDLLTEIRDALKK